LRAREADTLSNMPRPWYTDGGNLKGPTLITNNTIGGGGFAIDADGAGMPGAPFIIKGNTFVGQCVPHIACVDGSEPS
jgi:hypothetical protein